MLTIIIINVSKKRIESVGNGCLYDGNEGLKSGNDAAPVLHLGPLMGGPQCHVSNLRNGNGACLLTLHVTCPL